MRLAQAIVNHQAQSIVVKNETNWEEQQSSLADITDPLTFNGTGVGSTVDSVASNAFGGNNTFIAKYPGDLGNSLEVSMCPPHAAFATWDYREEFDGAPGTSAWDSDRGGKNDEVHVAVVDKKGAFTGTPGAILETYAYASVAKNALTADQANNYIKDIINERSEYVWMANFD